MQQRRIRRHRNILKKLNSGILPIAAALVLNRGQFALANTPATWEGTAGDYLWTTPTNWDIDAAPPTTSPYDDLTFGNGTVGTINLSGNEFANSLTFNAGFTLDSPGATNVLTNITGSITVGSSETATINSILAGSGSTSLKLSGGGTLILNNANTYTGSTNVNAGTLEVGNASAIYPSGVLTVSAGAGFLIDITPGPSTVTFNTSVSNSGSFTVDSGDSFVSNSSGGVFTQSAGTLTINGSLNTGGQGFNYSGGSVVGTVQIGSNSTVPTLSFASGVGNSGAFIITGEGATFSGANPRTIQSNQSVTLAPTAASGILSVSANISNQGSLTLSGTSTSTATLAMGTDTLTNTGTLTTAANATPSIVTDVITGTLNNTTGTVNVKASLTVNGNVASTGQINVAAGSILNLTAGTLTLNGGTITLAADATSPGVLKPGAMQFTGSSTTGTIASGVVGIGQSPGYIDLGGATSTLAIGAGIQPAQVIISAPITDGGLTKSGAGTLELSGANTYALGTTVTAGKLVIEPTTPTTSALPTGALSVSGGLVQLADNVTAGAPLATSNINFTSLSLTGTGTLDIGNNHIIIDYTTGNDPIASIETWINNGYYGLPGPAIISSDIATDDSSSGLSYGIGYADGADGAIAGLPSGEIEIMYTLLGDANLDGTVNSEDFTPFSTHLGQPGLWDDGDFNYDGTVNSEDFTPFSHNLNQTASLAAAAGDLETANAINLTNVPEPGCAVISLIAAFGLLQPRFRAGKRKRVLPFS